MTAPLDTATLYGMTAAQGWSAPSTMDDHASCEEAGQLYGGAFCVATHKPGVCAGTKRGSYHSGQPQPQAHQRPSVAVPAAPAAKTQQQALTEQAANAGYQQAYLAAQRLAEQLGGNQGHGRVQAAAHDYARAQHQHGRAVARADAARTRAQGRHDTAEARNVAIAKANAAAQAAAITRANAAAQKQKLHAAARRHPRARAQHSIWTDEVTLYGLVHHDPLGLYAQAAIAHWTCNVAEFCRNPLHPGPCKGWKHTLHAVAPGAYHAFEKDRVEKANNRRRAKIAALKAQGKPVPKGLLKEITYTAPGASQAQPGFTPPTPQAAKDVVSNIAGQVKTNVPVRAAQLTDQKLAAQAQALHDVVVAIQGKTNVAPDAVKGALTKIKGKQGPGDKLTDHPEVQKSISALVKNVGDKKGLTDKERGTLHTEITNHVEAGTPGVPQGVQDALKRPAVASAPSTAVGAPGSSPISIIQARVALKGLATLPDSKRLAAYDNLTKADLPSLTDNEQYLLESDLKGLAGLAGSPGQGFVGRKAAEIHSRLFGTGTPAPSAKPAAGPTPSAPLPATAAAHVKHAASVASRSAPGAALSKTHVDAYGKLTRAEFDSLAPATQTKIRDDLDAARAKFLDPKKRAAADALIARFEDKGGTGKHDASVLFSELDNLKAATDPADIANRYMSARIAAQTPERRDALEAHRAALEADTTLPAWLRARLHTGAPGYKPAGGTDVREALAVATMQPSNSGKWYATTYQLDDLLAPSDGELKKLAPVLQEAIKERRNESVLSLLGGGNNQRSTIGVVLGADATKPNLDRYHDLSPNAQQALVKAVESVRDASNGLDSGRFQVMLDKIHGVSHNPMQTAAIGATHDHMKTHLGRIAAYTNLPQKDFDALPQAHQTAIEHQLATAANSSDAHTRYMAHHVQAKFDGTLPTYSSGAALSAALAAGIHKADHDDPDRLRTYLMLDHSAYQQLNPGDQHLVDADMASLAGGSEPLGDRHQIQRHIDDLTGVRTPRSGDQKRAILVTDPHNRHSDSDVLTTLNPLSSKEYGELPKAYRDAIDERVTGLSASQPAGWAKIMAQLHPGWVSPHAPAAPATTSARPNVQEVLDTLYGVHPKAHTTAQQLKAYAGIRTADFQSLQPHEQSTLLGDLSYIVTTSKGGTNAARAQKLIDYFTPPGTPSGQIPNQPINVPANAVAGQNRYPDPGGRPGMLKQATSKGHSGDGFTRKINGGSGPWGKYGAAGVMLRHVDSSGVERYLMIERGPGISDPGKWQFPGGAIDSLETPHQGATRETIEELGFKNGALDDARVHGEHVFTIQGVVGPKNGEWKYTTIAATVPNQLTPDLSTHHARAETSDAKWMTIDEIRKLDKGGRLLTPLAGGALERNVVSLYPAAAPAVGRPAPVTKKLPRLTGTPSTPKPVTPHKPSRGRNLLTDKAAIDKLRQDVKHARAQYDGKTADGRLAAIGAMQGFDDTPTVVSKSEMDRLLATGDYIEVWRGVAGTYGGKSAEAINEEMRSGPAYYGKGVFGNGYYLAGQKSVAVRYSDRTKNSLLRILIPKAAVIETHEKMAKEASAIAKPTSAAKGSKFESGTLYDQGRYAAAKGVDGIRIDPVSYGQRSMSSHHVSKKGQEAYNWLNRSVLIIQEAE
jgi:8-oxo-dGTP pyrophosphatase MutT (NUDIX family)